MSDAWIGRWPVRSMTSDKVYTVGLKNDGTWGCDCPAWKFAKAPKPDCKHILAVKRVEPVDNRPNFPQRPKTPAERVMETMRPAPRPRSKPVISQPQRPVPAKPTAQEPYFVIQTRREIILED